MPTTRRPAGTESAARGNMALEASVVVDPDTLEPVLAERQRQDPDERGRGPRGGVAALEELEGVIDDVLHQRLGCIVRATLGHHHHRIKDVQGVYQGGDNDEERGGRQQRQGDVAEACPGAGAVDRRGLVQTAGNVLKARQQNQRVKAHPLPCEHYHHRWQCPRRIVQPRRSADPDHAQQKVEQSVVTIEQPRPDQRDRHPGRDVRDVVDAAKRADTRDRLIHQQRERQSTANRHRHAAEAEHHRVLERVPELAVRQEPAHVVEANKARLRQQVPAQQAEIERPEHRHNREHDVPEQRETEEGVTDGSRAPRPPPVVAHALVSSSALFISAASAFMASSTDARPLKTSPICLPRLAVTTPSRTPSGTPVLPIWTFWRLALAPLMASTKAWMLAGGGEANAPACDLNAGTPTPSV